MHYIAGLNHNAEMTIKLGDGINGKKPASGAPVIVDYFISDGAGGNVARDRITEIISALTLPPGQTLLVRNPEKASGGADSDSTASIISKIPKHRRTLERAVTASDFADIAVLVAGVDQAGAISRDCHHVDIHIVPASGGIASSILIQNVADFIEPRRILGIKVNVRTAGEVRLYLVVNVRAKSNYLNASVANNVITNLEAFGSPLNQAVGGLVTLGDLYEVIENTPGVHNSNIIEFTTIPFAMPYNHANGLIWDRKVKSGSTATVQYKIKAQGPGVYELYRANSFLGVKNIGEPVETTELSLQVNTGTYNPGEEWLFYTYPYNQNIDLIEMSIPAIYADDLKLNVTGGI
jgi:hypothetical protein